MDQITQLQNINDQFHMMINTLKKEKDSEELVEFNAEVLETLTDEMREILMQREPVWFDVDAQYYSLEDTDRTPMNVKWIKDGTIRFKSENNSHFVTTVFDDIENWVTKLPSNN